MKRTSSNDKEDLSKLDQSRRRASKSYAPKGSAGPSPRQATPQALQDAHHGPLRPQDDPWWPWAAKARETGRETAAMAIRSFGLEYRAGLPFDSGHRGPNHHPRKRRVIVGPSFRTPSPVLALCSSWTPRKPGSPRTTTAPRIDRQLLDGSKYLGQPIASNS